MPKCEVPVNEKPEPILGAQCDIKRATVSDLFACPEITELLQEYADQSSNTELPPANPQQEIYMRMEEAGFFHVIAAFRGRELIGFAAVVVAVLPHYGVPVATMESIFVRNRHRHYGAGIKLVREAENLAREQGAKGLLVTAPAGGRLSLVMPKIGYRKTNTVFFRVL